MVRLLFFLFISFYLGACSTRTSVKSNAVEVRLEGYEQRENIDYIDHIKSFESDYINSRKGKVLILSRDSQKYLDSLIRNIESSNELFFTNLQSSKFYIIQDEIPFHFSLPGKVFFFSSGLLKKYIKNEVMLYCLLAYELIRSEKNIYQKHIIIPTGSLSTRKILSLLRLKLNDKVEVHKWAYYVLKRIGIQPDSYLSYLQVVNRNSIDFATQLGDIHSISQEEAKFKAFLIENEVGKTRKRHSGSSTAFYNFIKNIKG